MKYIFTVLLLLILFSCSDLDDANKDLCVATFCGEVKANQVNLTVYNNTGVDFEPFYWDIGGVRDTVEFFPLEQFACWTNHDSLTTNYFYAIGKSENQIYELDTIWVDSTDIRIIRSGNFSLELYRNDTSSDLLSALIEDYSGECRDFR
ncbi:hypothetical protein JKA74_02905 [Marivirga sp. S37H4]|uniref:Uncharacterized protein n=1 Tax=Marivirga aurantiaca TaxID=2802615 RepID=A0A934WVS7_9BACT|nr:hypothetical protein [Marivirga aurantiaca]MBK6263973.1 hypothetical protein [Marivirga aurantiaca]